MTPPVTPAKSDAKTRSATPPVLRPDAPCYTYAANHVPALTVEPGSRVVVETMDAFNNAVRSPADRPSEVAKPPRVNPLTGPIAVTGAVPGDALHVRIATIEPLRDYAVTALIPNFGGLVPSANTPMLAEPLPEEVRLLPLRDGRVWLGERTSVPFAPFLGSIGTAPQFEAIASLVPGPHGGNMDCLETAPGVDLYFPVRAPGGLLFLGDAHACQGDGEITGVAAEIPARVTLTLDRVPDWPLAWPRFVSAERLMVAASLRPLDDAVRAAAVDLIAWLEADFGLDRRDAYHLLGQAMRLRIGNVVDPANTVVASIARDLLPDPLPHAHARLHR